MTTKRLVRISYFTMLTVIGGLISIPIPFTVIRMTLQTLFVAASGLVLGARDGAFSQLAYMIIGLIGLPVFSNYSGGFAYVLQPSFGYIIGFVLQAFLTGLLAGKQKTLSSFKLFLCALAGVAVGYAIGITYQVIALMYFSAHNTFVAAIATIPSVLVMLAKDIVLIYLLCLLYPRIMNLIGKRDEQAKKQEEEQAVAESPEQGEQGGDDPEPEKEKPKKNPVPEPAGMRNGE